MAKAHKKAKPKKLPSTIVMATTPEHLRDAWYVRPGIVHLVFDDGYNADVALSALGILTRTLDLKTAKVTPNGLSVKMANGHRRFVIDSATLRYETDPVYRANMDAEIGRMLIPSDDLERTAAQRQPPQEWFDHVEELD